MTCFSMIAISIHMFTVHKYICRKIKGQHLKGQEFFFSPPSPILQVVHWVALSSSLAAVRWSLKSTRLVFAVWRRLQLVEKHVGVAAANVPGGHGTHPEDTRLTGTSSEASPRSDHVRVNDKPHKSRDTWSRCSCTTRRARDACSTPYNGLPRRFHNGWTLRTGRT